RRRAETERLDPLARSRETSAGVDDEVGKNRTNALPRLLRTDADDAPAVAEEADGARAIDDAHVGDLEQLLTDGRLEQRPAEEQAFDAAVETRLVAPVLKPANVLDEIARHRAGAQQIAFEQRKERLQPLKAAGEETMPVPALRGARPLG